VPADTNRLPPAWARIAKTTRHSAVAESLPAATADPARTRRSGSAAQGRDSETFRKTAGVSPTFITIAPDLVDTAATDLSDEWAAGGLISTPSDLVTFARALRDGRLIGRRSLAFMESWAPAFPGMEAGHGLFRFKVDGEPVISHPGGVLGYTAVLWWSERSDVIVALLCNGSGMHAGRSRPDATVALRPDLVARNWIGPGSRYPASSARESDN